jgi:hypothetical protein
MKVKVRSPSKKKVTKLINLIYSDWIRNKSSRFFYFKKEKRRLELEYGKF